MSLAVIIQDLYGFSKASSRAALAVVRGLAMDISVGVVPNFVRHLGQIETNHSREVLAVDDQGEVMVLERPSHPCVFELAMVMVAYFLFCGVRESKAKGAGSGAKWVKL